MFPLQNILVPLGVFAMVVLILWFSHVTRRRAQEQRAEIIRRMIEKFSTGEAFAQAIQGPVGSKLASALALESEKPSKKWKGLFVPASILTFMGIGFSVLALVRDEDFLIPAVIIGAVGVALAVSTYVMWRAEERDGEESGGANAKGIMYKSDETLALNPSSPAVQSTQHQRVGTWLGTTHRRNSPV